jgi:hypothetical protein
MYAAVALALVLAAQVACWWLFRAGSFVAALVSNGLFWCVAFPFWTVAARRWWRTSVTPDLALALALILVTAGCFYLAQGLADAAYCTGLATMNQRGCWMPPPARDAFLWVGLMNVPVALIAAALATLRTRALRGPAEARGVGADRTPGPKPVTALVIAAVILGVALVAFAVLIVANSGPVR